MSDRNWDAELARIDRQLASVSDEELLASTAPAATGRSGVARAPVTGAPSGASPARAGGAAGATVPAGGAWRAWVKVGIAVAAAAGLMYWPWPARCGLPLVGFTAATGGVALLGLWSAVGTWRHRTGVAHVASLLVVLWGLALGAREVLPRFGYAVPTAARGATWSCEATAPAAAPDAPPAPTPAAPATAPTGSPTATIL
jgi:hypothetical protein